jgi:hypothetical protein
MSGQTSSTQDGDWLIVDEWFSLVSSINKTDRHDITEILLKVALNTMMHQLLTNHHPVLNWSDQTWGNLHKSCIKYLRRYMFQLRKNKSK